MTKVLITGGCGFIGSNLVGFLLENTDWHINVLDNLTTGSLNNIKNHLKDTNRVIFLKGDITEKTDVSKDLSNCEYVVNLAAQTSVINSIDAPFEDQRINVQGTLNILDQARSFGIKKVIQASSAAAIGNQEMPLDEKKVPEPISPYGASKLAGEGYCSAFSGSYGLNTVVLRFSNVYGPKSIEKGSVVAKFIKKIMRDETLTVYGDGTQTRDFIYVDDICKGIYLSIVGDTTDYNLFQLGTGTETSINVLIKKLGEIFKEKDMAILEVKHEEPREGEIWKNYTDISKAKKYLNFSIDYNLNNGLENTINWFLKNYSP